MQKQKGWFVLSGSLALGLGTWTDALAANGQDGAPWGMPMMWGSWGISMMIMMILFWAAIIVGLVVLIRWLWTTGNSRHQGMLSNASESPLDILKKRYARGELSKQEFETMRQDIQG